MRWSVLPAAAHLTDDQRKLLQSGIRQRWARVVGAASGLLLVSGLINFVNTIKSHTFQGPLAGSYHALLGVKLLLALAVFLLAALLSGRSAASERIRARQALWLNVAVGLGVVLVCLGGLMKMIDRIPK